FEVERDSCDFARQIQKFAGHHTLEPVYFGDAVTGLNDSSYFSYFEARIVAFDLLADDLTYFVCSDSVHRCLPVQFLLPTGGAAFYVPSLLTTGAAAFYLLSLLSPEGVVCCVELRLELHFKFCFKCRFQTQNSDLNRRFPIQICKFQIKKLQISNFKLFQI